MSFQPVLPGEGLVAWRYLQRTYSDQVAAFAGGGAQQRELDYFRDRIGTVETAAQLVGDRRLLAVTLRAFGLEADIDARFLVRKVLEEGSVDPGALANRLSDHRYREMARAFGFGDPGGANTGLPGFADRIAARFAERSFEAAIGERDETMRLALNARRELAAIASASGSDAAHWFTVMGTPPLRKVVEGALGLPASIGALDLDRQLEEFRARARGAFGTDRVADLAAEPRLSKVIDTYLLRAPSSGGTVTSPALMILRGS